ncbi:MAG TPA: hypothetical protein VLB80_04990 [Candidatus Babeliales bacterium]|nr:hypothetical protein [Candidatus Babeliales bacterium]
MKYGFMLIELIVATMVATMVAAILLAALAQGSRFQIVIDNMIDTSVRIGVISNQLEKDLMGAFIPVQAEKTEDTKNKKNDTNKPTEAQDDTEQKSTQKKEPKIIDKIFYSINKDGKFDTLTFITNNPLTVFVGKDVGIVKPKVVRVQYTLKADPDKKDSYALFRQESMELDLENFKNVRAYEVIDGIKNCSITFTARIEKKQEEQKPSANEKSSQEKQKISYEYKVLNEWVSEQKGDADKDKSEFPRIPYSVEIKIALWDKQEKREKDFTLVCHIPNDIKTPQLEENQLEQPTKGKIQEKNNDKEQPENSIDKNKSPVPNLTQAMHNIVQEIVVVAENANKSNVIAHSFEYPINTIKRK